MCGASEISASECAVRPAAPSPAMNARISASAAASHRPSPPAPWACPVPCACSLVIAGPGASEHLAGNQFWVRGGGRVTDVGQRHVEQQPYVSISKPIVSHPSRASHLHHPV